MLKNVRIRSKVLIVLLLVFILSLPVMIAGSYYVLRQNIDQETFDKAQLFLTSMESVRKQIGKVARPAVQQVANGVFVVEAMSTSYAARGVAERVKESFPNYSFRHVSLNPRQPLNKADYFEADIIANLTANRSLKQLQGYVQRNGEEYFYVAKPVQSDQSCQGCHGTPEIAPKEVLAAYGSTAAFGWKADESEVVAALMVYVPTAVAKRNAMKALAVFTGFYAGIFLLSLLVIDRLIVNSIIKPITHFVEVADAVSRGKLDMEFTSETNDEIKVLAGAFERMKVSVVKAMEQLTLLRKMTK